MTAHTVTIFNCPCEDVSHEEYFDDIDNVWHNSTGHDYFAEQLTEGSRYAEYIGRVCKDCAETHMKEYLV